MTRFNPYKILQGLVGRKSLVILYYHRVLSVSDDSAGNMSQYVFKMQMALLKRWFNVIALDDAVRQLQSKCLPARAVCVTFDDGYRDNYEIAYPILDHFKLPATFFVATEYLNGGIMWNDVVSEVIQEMINPALSTFAVERGLPSGASRELVKDSVISQLKYLPHAEREREAKSLAMRFEVDLPRNLMMTQEMVRELHRRGMSIGAHTRTHPILSCVRDEFAREEIEGSKRDLETLIGADVSLFAFPNGKKDQDFREQHVAMVRDLGFSTAVTTEFGAVTQCTDPLLLPRCGLWDTVGWRILFRLATYFSN